MTDDERTPEADSTESDSGVTTESGTAVGGGDTGRDAVADKSIEADTEHAQHRRRSLPIWQESILLLVVAVVLAILVKALLVQAFYIPSASMEPGLVTNDRILVEKPSYWFGGTPSRGDVVVFEDPGGWLEGGEGIQVSGLRNVLSKIGLYPSGGHLVKRVIGVPGDTIVCCDDEGRISVNGVALDEDDYIAPRRENIQCNGPMISQCDWTAGPVPEGSIFVMGDNRANSADSTVHLCLRGETDCTDNPFVDTDLVVGKVFAVVWPRRNMQLVRTPGDFDDVTDAK